MKSLNTKLNEKVKNLKADFEQLLTSKANAATEAKKAIDNLKNNWDETNKKKTQLKLVRASCVRHTLLVYHCFHACSSSSFFLSAHPSLQPPTKNSRKQKLLGSALVTDRSSGKLSGSPQGLSIPLN